MRNNDAIHCALFPSHCIVESATAPVVEMNDVVGLLNKNLVDCVSLRYCVDDPIFQIVSSVVNETKTYLKLRIARMN